MAAPRDSVAAEKVRLLYDQLPWVLAANAIISALVVAVLWTPAQAAVLLSWGLGHQVLVAARAVLLVQYHRRRPDHPETGWWQPAYAAGSTFSGALWGSMALVVLDPANPLSLVLIAFVIGGMAAGALGALYSHMPTLVLFLLASVTPLGIVLMIVGGATQVTMGMMVLVYVCGLLLMGRRYNRTLTRMLVLAEERQRFLNLLERQVRERTTELQEANRRLLAEVAERERAQAEAEQANWAKSRFLAAASHDLRQPLQSIVLFGAMLRKHVSDPKGLEVLGLMRRGLDSLTALLDSLLDLSRLDVHATQAEFAELPLRPLLQDIAAAYQPVAATKGLSLTLDIDSDCTVRSDANLLGRMVRNLLENAVRYTEHGGIRLSCRTEAAVARISVQDTGSGIAPDQIQRIFEEFHRGPGRRGTADRGLGLGLSIVQKLSHLLGHPVEVTSTPGRGSTFSILVPLVDAAAGPPTAADAEAPESGAGKTIVVVEDDALLLQGLTAVLRDWGYVPIAAASTEQALAGLAGADAPAGIIADFRLRGGRSGADAIAAIRRHCASGVPAIILTGETGGDPEGAAAMPDVTMLRKPVAPAALAAALRRATVTPPAHPAGTPPPDRGPVRPGD